ncbi:helix-turn-helix domain-containing protein [Methanobrevibacter sp.]|uniref:helix-turn-helix domain-containing protein n=1 Tax=Methanobrevibacter sp. TaxID=66852 RepID=UPI00389019A1
MKKRILKHLQEFGFITTKISYDEYGCTRLSEYIRQLREDGYIIVNKTVKGLNRFGEKVWYDEFWLMGRRVKEQENATSL